MKKLLMISCMFVVLISGCSMFSKEAKVKELLQQLHEVPVEEFVTLKQNSTTQEYLMKYSDLLRETYAPIFTEDALNNASTRKYLLEFNEAAMNVKEPIEITSITATENAGNEWAYVVEYKIGTKETSASGMIEYKDKKINDYVPGLHPSFLEDYFAQNK